MSYHNSYHLFIFNVFFPLQISLFFAPAGYIFFVFYIRKGSYAAMFVNLEIAIKKTCIADFPDDSLYYYDLTTEKSLKKLLY